VIDQIFYDGGSFLEKAGDVAKTVGKGFGFFMRMSKYMGAFSGGGGN